MLIGAVSLAYKISVDRLMAQRLVSVGLEG